jgi:hypothetical protein
MRSESSLESNWRAYMGCVFSGTLSILGMPYLLLFTTLWPLSVLFLVWIAYDWNTHIQGKRWEPNQGSICAKGGVMGRQRGRWIKI